MTARQSIPKKAGIPFCSITPFLFITFGLAWGILALYIFLPNKMTGIFGKLTGQHPLFFLCVYAPAIASFIIIAYYAGRRGVLLFLSRLLLWRCSPFWYAFIIIGIPLVFYAGSMLKGNLFGEPFSFTSLGSLFMALLFAAIKGPVEEFGWRGLALPLLQRKFKPIWAGLILGVIWGFWHLPAFLLSGTQQSEWAFAPFFVGCISLSVIVTVLFNASRGSIILSALFHFMLMNPISPDAEPYDTYLFSVIAILIVWINRKTMFSKKGAILDVLPDEETIIN